MKSFTPEEMENGFNLPITTSDAAGMLRVRIPRNGRPYDCSVMKLNNARVDEWKENVLDKMSSNRKVPAGIVWESWKLFDEGQSTLKLMEMIKCGAVPEVPEKVVEFWKTFFENSTVEEMHEYGSGTISTGWQLLTLHIKLWYVKEKYNALFSQSDDPLHWEKNHHKHTPILRGEVLPFWDKETFKEISEKVRTILQIQVQPDTTNYSRMM